MGRGHPQGLWKLSPRNGRSLVVKERSRSSERRLFDEHCWDDEKVRICENPSGIATRWWKVDVHFAGGMDGCDMRPVRALERGVVLDLAL